MRLGDRGREVGVRSFSDEPTVFLRSIRTRQCGFVRFRCQRKADLCGVGHLLQRFEEIEDMRLMRVAVKKLPMRTTWKQDVADTSRRKQQVAEAPHEYRRAPVGSHQSITALYGDVLE